MSKNDKAKLTDLHRRVRDDAGYAAQLRRLRQPNDALFLRPTHDHLASLAKADLKSRARALRALQLLAFARQHVPGRLGAQLKGAGLHEARFRRLVMADDDDPTDALRQVLAIMRYNCNVIELFEAAYWWNERTKEQLAVSYYSEKST